IESRVLLAKLYLASGALNDALKISNAAIEIDGRNLPALNVKAVTLFRLKDTNGATQTAQKVIEIEPRNIDAHVFLASAKFLVGYSDSALKILAQVPADHQEDLGVMLLKANIYGRKGDSSQVESILRRLIVLNPTDSNLFRQQLIRFYLSQKRPEE